MVAQVTFFVALILYITPFFIIPIIHIPLFYTALQRFYITTSRELKRLDSLMRSPIFGLFEETLQGLSTIRVFGTQSAYICKNRARIDQSTRALFAFVTSHRWLEVRLELLGAIFVFAVAFTCILAHNPNPSFAGLALTTALTISASMTWMVRENADLEMDMNAVERVLDSSSMKPEEPFTTKRHPPPSSWPVSGAIEACKIVVRYRSDLDPVLNGVSFAITSGEKVGIFGRSGCGKTTLMMSLCRLVPIERGTMKMDGIDVESIPLAELRSKIGVVLQTPVVFSGTVRFNMDPVGRIESDTELWDVLNKCGLAATVAALPEKLESVGIATFSTGQRQLLCLARALVRKCKVLILDEATAHVDNKTNVFIQKMVETTLKDLTVLTVAHRWSTISKCDRVMQLEDGKIAKFDVPTAFDHDTES